MSTQVPFEQGDMEFLKAIIDPMAKFRQFDNLLSHGRTERIVAHIENMTAKLDEIEKVHLNSNLSWQQRHVAIGEIFLSEKSE